MSIDDRQYKEILRRFDQLDARFDQLNGRVRKTETRQALFTGGLIIMGSVVLPVAIVVIKFLLND